MHTQTENIYSIFRDKLLLLGEHVQAAEQALQQKLEEECLKQQRGKQKCSKEHKKEEEQRKQAEDEKQRAKEIVEEEAARAHLVSPSNSSPMEVEMSESVPNSIINGTSGDDGGIKDRNIVPLQRTNKNSQPPLRQNWHPLQNIR
jgi:hypothetical protein